MPVHESDICIIGGGITSAMLAERLASCSRASASSSSRRARRSSTCRTAAGTASARSTTTSTRGPTTTSRISRARASISMTMAVGGLALHWGGACNRFSEEDLRLKSMYGLAVDWPIDGRELERYYCEAEKRLNVSGEPSPHPEDRRTQPYPQKPIPLSYNLQILKNVGRAERHQVLAAADGAQPVAVRRPRQLLRLRHVRRGVSVGCALLAGLHLPPADPAEEDRRCTIARSCAGSCRTTRDRQSSSAQAVHQDRPDDPIEYRAKTFVVASGYCWSSHLLLLSANSRFPNGIANRRASSAAT